MFQTSQTLPTYLLYTTKIIDSGLAGPGYIFGAGGTYNGAEHGVTVTA